MRMKSASKITTRDLKWLGPAIPPGEILLEEYLKPLGLGQLEAAKRLGISLNRLSEIVLGKSNFAGRPRKRPRWRTRRIRRDVPNPLLRRRTFSGHALYSFSASRTARRRSV